MVRTTAAGVSPHRATAALVVLLGVWVFFSPWIYRAGMNINAWNGWLVGALITLLALIQAGSPSGSHGLAKFNVLLGAWIFASPWIYGYTGDVARWINSLCAGAAIFALSLYAATAHVSRTTLPAPPRT